MQIRLLAALSLYSLGDDTGFELIEHFVNGTEFSLSDIGDIPEWPWLDTFLSSVLHLRPHTDELLLKCFGSSHFHPYPYYRWADTIGDAEYAFARQYERQLLPVLVEQLNNKNPMTRKRIHALLMRLTGQDFGFQPDKFVFQQTKSIERWRSYVEDYLATSSDSGK